MTAKKDYRLEVALLKKEIAELKYAVREVEQLGYRSGYSKGHNDGHMLLYDESYQKGVEAGKKQATEKHIIFKFGFEWLK